MRNQRRMRETHHSDGEGRTRNHLLPLDDRQGGFFSDKMRGNEPSEIVGDQSRNFINDQSMEFNNQQHTEGGDDSKMQRREKIR